MKKQEMQAEADQQGEAMKMAQMRQMFSAAGDLAGAMKGAKTDAIANKLMNEDAPPVATAVDPSLQKEVMADRAAAGIEGPAAPATGGLDEMKLRLKMDDQKMQRMALQLRGQQEARMEGVVRNDATARQQADASKAISTIAPPCLKAPGFRRVRKTQRMFQCCPGSPFVPSSLPSFPCS